MIRKNLALSAFPSRKSQVSVDRFEFDSPANPHYDSGMSSHPDKHIREAIEFAESLGWTFEKSVPRAHSFGILYCPQNERGACRIVVYSTPKTPFLHAQRITRAVNKCPHGEDQNG